MKNGTFFLLLLSVMACNFPKHTEGSDQRKVDQLIPKMSIEELQEATMVISEVEGSFQQHPEIIENLRSYLQRQGIAAKNCVGIYPEDPDAVPASELNWKVGFELTRDDIQIDANEYKVETIPGGTALVVESSVKNSAIHGLYCKVWLLEHNYVQTQPTRMIYHFDSQNPEEQSTTIIFPIVKRTRDIPVITKSTLDHHL